MKIIDIIKDSSNLLGLDIEINILETATEETEAEVLKSNANIYSLFNLIKFSIRELCSNYMPIEREESVATNDKKIPVSTLENFIRIHGVSKDAEPVKYKVVNRNILFEEDGVYQICYETYPTIESMFEDMDFLQDLSPDVIVFGLCAYFALAHGRFDEFEDFHERYVSKAESLKDLRVFELPCRRWE